MLIQNVNNVNNPSMLNTVNTLQNQQNNPENPHELENNPQQEDTLILSTAAERLQNETQGINTQQEGQNLGLNPVENEGNPEGEQAPPVTNVQTTIPENEAPSEPEGVENPEPEVHENRNQQQRQQQIEANRAAARGTQDQNPMLDLTV